MTGLVDAVRYHAAALDATRPQPRFGTVESVDPGRHLAKVLIQPEGVLSGWLPILALGAGSGWGLICPPAIGAQVVVVPLDGDHENLAVLPGAWSTASLPPQPPMSPGGGASAVNPGEMALVSVSGSYLRLSVDGSVVLVTTGPLTASVTGNATIETTGNAVVNAGGNATIEAANDIALSAPNVTGGNGSTSLTLCTSDVWTWLLSHTHSDPQGGSTGVPLQSAPGNPLTTNFKAT